jgi:hypothetical protein
MPIGRPKQPLSLTEEERDRLQSLAHRARNLALVEQGKLFRRNRFSAIRAKREVRNNRRKVTNSILYNDLCTSLLSGPNFCGPQGLSGVSQFGSHYTPKGVGPLSR